MMVDYNACKYCGMGIDDGSEIEVLGTYVHGGCRKYVDECSKCGRFLSVPVSGHDGERRCSDCGGP